ncbi:conserved hypothetical protein [Culex quinquefasciatus]|uniref:RNase H type-1 domain-containing protein n=1 Tax=Culex quinquefasciatus TaxID=7176 RepID=B0W4G4_CULQU|nr:conserved hypothetical protein [Culex quinquefasciatus]|eukprot:XP_001843598.1 conserved hypothetical protein [Culex quinquefasciatus]
MRIQMAGVGVGTGVGKLDGVAQCRRRTMIGSGNTVGGLRAGIFIDGLIWIDDGLVVLRIVCASAVSKRFRGCFQILGTQNCLAASKRFVVLIRIHGTHVVSEAVSSCIDSKFLIDSITKWLPGWKRNAWKLSTGKPVKNQVDFEELDRELADKSIEIKWNHVDAHCGILGNERADALAREGSAISDEKGEPSTLNICTELAKVTGLSTFSTDSSSSALTSDVKLLERSFFTVAPPPPPKSSSDSEIASSPISASSDRASYCSTSGTAGCVTFGAGSFFLPRRRLRSLSESSLSLSLLTWYCLGSWGESGTTLRRRFRYESVPESEESRRSWSDRSPVLTFWRFKLCAMTRFWWSNCGNRSLEFSSACLAAFISACWMLWPLEQARRLPRK